MEELQQKIGQTFFMERFGIRQDVVLEDIKKDKVQLREPDRKDSFKLPLKKFNKFYQQAK